MLPWADWKGHTWYEQGSKPAEVKHKHKQGNSRSHVAKAAPPAAKKAKKSQ